MLCKSVLDVAAIWEICQKHCDFIAWEKRETWVTQSSCKTQKAFFSQQLCLSFDLQLDALLMKIMVRIVFMNE